MKKVFLGMFLLVGLLTFLVIPAHADFIEGTEVLSRRV